MEVSWNEVLKKLQEALMRKIRREKKNEFSLWKWQGKTTPDKANIFDAQIASTVNGDFPMLIS